MDKQINELSTIGYYDSYAQEYCELSKNADLTDIYTEFEKHVIPKGAILDAGCGSGRDSAYFSKKGYVVTSVDLSKEMCKIASSIPGITVINADFSEINYSEEFDGIWACSSLLHIPKSNMSFVLAKLIRSLKHHGVLYASWKYGKAERYDKQGRFYSDYTKKSLLELFSNYDEIEVIKCWITSDTLNRNNNKWINILIKRC